MDIKILHKSEGMPSESNPVEFDCLNRKPSIDFLTDLIISADQPFVLSVESAWGTGKTTFIQLWQAQLPKGMLSVRFNAWETDYFEDPLLAFLSEVNSQLSEQVKNYKKIINTLFSIGFEIAKTSMPVLIEGATNKILDRQLLKKIFANFSRDSINAQIIKLTDEKLDELKNRKKTVKEFRKNLEQLIEKLQKDNENNYPIVIFVDELDRCRPDYALKLLERIKHLFNINNVVFILAIDRQQLSQIVRSVYGVQETDEYLRRFIDLSYKIPNPSRTEFCRRLFQEYKLEKIVIEKNCSSNFLVEYLGELADYYQMSLRALDQCYTLLNVILRTSKNLECGILYFLVALKSAFPEYYENLRDKVVNIEIPSPDVFNDAMELRAVSDRIKTIKDIDKGSPEKLRNYFPPFNIDKTLEENHYFRLITCFWFYTASKNTMDRSLNALRRSLANYPKNLFIDVFQRLRDMENGEKYIRNHFDKIDMISGQFFQG